MKLSWRVRPEVRDRTADVAEQLGVSAAGLLGELLAALEYDETTKTARLNFTRQASADLPLTA